MAGKQPKKLRTLHWERGHRVHGYWLGVKRVASIGLPPHRTTSYFWELDDSSARGEVSTLREAKRCVEEAFAARLIELARLFLHWFEKDGEPVDGFRFRETWRLLHDVVDYENYRLGLLGKRRKA